MRTAKVYSQEELAGELSETDDGCFRFVYDPSYLASGSPAISLSLPKQPAPFLSEILFPFFFGLLSEGSTRALQLRTLRIDEADLFGLLLATGQDTVGSISIRGPR